MSDIVKDLATRAFKDELDSLIKKHGHDLAELSIQIFALGVRNGIRTYAHWCDGEQYVGTCGTTLKEALKAWEIDDES